MIIVRVSEALEGILIRTSSTILTVSGHDNSIEANIQDVDLDGRPVGTPTFDLKVN